MNELISIETSRLIIRQFLPSDANDLFEYLSLPSIYEYEPGKPISRSEAIELATKRSLGIDFLAVTQKNTSKLIGHLYFKQIEPFEFNTWELGYIFNPNYHRQGYASEASHAITAYGFKHYNIHRIMARCNPNNTASWKLLEKIGFNREGHFKKCAFFHRDNNGNPIWHDAFEYSKLAEK